MPIVHLSAYWMTMSVIYAGVSDFKTPSTFQTSACLVQVQNGDTIRIDAQKRTIDATNVNDKEWDRRRQGWKAPPLKFTSGTLYKYIKNVSSASLGCVTDL